jgi:hypothetical protein
MINIKTASLAISLAVLTSAANAQAIIQYSDSQGYGYRTEPLYPYAPPQRGAMRTEKPRVETRAAAAAPPAKKVDPALIEELRNKRKASAKPNTMPKASADVTASIDPTPDKKKFTKTTIVRDKPVVRTTYRVVEHPPIVVQREVGEDQAGEGGGHAHGAPQGTQLGAPQGAPPAGARTIRAEAEITILGPDRMSIRLFRRQDGVDANAKVGKRAPNLAPKSAPKRSAKAEGKTKIR